MDWVRIVAGDGLDLRAYEGVTPPTPMRRSLMLPATDFAPRADGGAAPDILSSRLSLSSNKSRAQRSLVFRALWCAP